MKNNLIARSINTPLAAMVSMFMLLTMLLLMPASDAFANDKATATNPNAASLSTTVGQVKLDLIKQLEKDGYLSTKMSAEAKAKYVDPSELSVPLASPGTTSSSSPSFMERYVTWTNVFRVLGVVALLVAFGSFIGKIAAGLMFIIAAVPKEVYQVTFVSFFALMTLRPDILWASQAYYLALFGAFANLTVLAWVVESHPRLQEVVEKIFRLGIPPACVVSFWAMLYFGALAVMHQSQIFGFAAAVSLSGMLSFAMYYSPGVLSLGFHEKGTPAVVFGHLVVLTVYALAKITGNLPAEAALFTVGLEYYCTIAMGVGFLVGASPFDFAGKSNAGGYLALFAVVAFAAIAGYHFYDLKVIGSIVCVFGVLLVLEWIGYLSYHAGFMVGAGIVGVSLYGFSLLLERYGNMLVLTMA